MDPRHQQDDRLAALLTAAARPTTRPSPELAADIAALTGAVVAPRTRRRRVPVVAAALVPLLVLGGAGAAFASGAIDWSQFFPRQPEWTGWATHPDAAITYELPSGRSCTMRIGAVSYSPAARPPAGVTADPASADLAREYLRGGTVLDDAPIGEVIAEDREKDVNWTTDSDGKQVRFGYGTAHYDADVEYSIAMKEAVQVAIERHLSQAGVPSTGLSYSSQEQCTEDAR